MALTLRLTSEEQKELEEIKVLLGKPNMTSSGAILLLIRTFKQRENLRIQLENNVRKQEEVLSSLHNSLSLLFDYNNSIKKNEFEK